MMKTERRKEVKAMMFDEHRARMMAEQRRREAEMAQRAYELKMKKGEHDDVPDDEGKTSKAKKRGRLWRFFIG